MLFMFVVNSCDKLYQILDEYNVLTIRAMQNTIATVLLLFWTTDVDPGIRRAPNNSIAIVPVLFQLLTQE